MLLKRSLTTIGLLVCGALACLGQTRQDIANLVQDVAIMRQELGRLSYEVQTLRNENQLLQAKLNEGSLKGSQWESQLSQLRSDVDSKLADLRTQLINASDKQKELIIANVSEQIEQFAAETQRAFEQLQKNTIPSTSEAKPVNAPGKKTEFGDDFPKTGLEYTVQKGDNLWKIAQDLKSKISWIQDANRISNPTQLKVGTVLFVPQKAQ